MKRVAALLAALQLLFVPSMLAAQGQYGARVVSTTSWVEEWDPASQSWVRIEADASAAFGETVTTTTTVIVNGAVVSEFTETEEAASRYAMPERPGDARVLLGQYGPFRVLDARRAALVGSTGIGSPAQFDAMLRDFPQLEVLEMVEAPGTRNDIANLAVGRRIRAAGIATHVPGNGSVRSGAVELFLAGATRTMEPGAQFAVHSWLDNYGREPGDFAPDAPENRLYLDYYVEMGMSEARARDFYAMTNSVPHAAALWLRAADMEPWIAPESRAPSFAMREAPLSLPELATEPVELAVIVAEAPRIAYSDGLVPAGL